MKADHDKQLTARRVFAKLLGIAIAIITKSSEVAHTVMHAFIPDPGRTANFYAEYLDTLRILLRSDRFLDHCAHVLPELGLSPIDAQLGLPPEANRHLVVRYEWDPALKPDIVSQVFSRGWTLGGTVLLPAHVAIVAYPPVEDSDQAPPGQRGLTVHGPDGSLWSHSHDSTVAFVPGEPEGFDETFERRYGDVITRKMKQAAGALPPDPVPGAVEGPLKEGMREFLHKFRFPGEPELLRRRL